MDDQQVIVSLLAPAETVPLASRSFDVGEHSNARPLYRTCAKPHEQAEAVIATVLSLERSADQRPTFSARLGAN
jgi:hypothetical protein